LIGCTQGVPNSPSAGADPASSQAHPDGDTPRLPGEDNKPNVSNDGGSPLPPAVVTLSQLAPFDLAPSKLFSPVLQAERALPPLSGGTLAVAVDGTAVLSDPDRDQVYIADPNKKTSVTISLTAGDEPGRVAVRDRRAYVALRASGALVTIDLTTQKVSARTAVCAAPRGVFFDVSEARVLVACAGGDLVSVAADGASVLAKSHVASDLRDVGRDGQGIWVTQFRAAALLRLDASLKISSRAQPAQTARVSNLLNPGTSIGLSPTLAFRTVASSSGEPWMLHQRAQTSPVTPEFGGYGAFQGGFCESGIVHTTVTRFDSATPAVQAALPQAVVPLDLGLSPDGRFLAVIAPGNFVRQDLMPASNGFEGGFFAGNTGPAQQLFFVKAEALKRSKPEALLGEVQQDCVSDAGRWEHRFPGEATAVQFVDARSFVVQVRNPAELHVFRIDDADNPRLSAIIPLSPLALRDTGHEIFHQNSGAGLACASCHGEASDDAHVWTFADVGERRTQHLRGGILKTAPFHWSGDLSDMNALIDDVYQKRMGGSVLPADARAALSAWLDRLPLVPSEARDAAAASRGRALFESAAVGCTSCHAGDALRSPGSHDVGTGGSFEVPSLHGVSLRLPLMHNGCADTLQKRFDAACGGGDKHGTTSQLSAAQVEDLVAYLESL
jgi:DNA-binding beta-propeller fold protein YncE/mono/diheme cytochrome c family protein